jgi:hypothetical protein
MRLWDPRIRSSVSGGLGLVSSWMRQGYIRSIQVVRIVGATTATITAVDTSNTILIHQGDTHGADTATASRVINRLTLTNSTTVTATGNANTTASGVVIEFFAGVLKSVQTGTVSTNTTSTAPITAVNTSKAFVIHLGTSGSVGDATPVNQASTEFTLTNATTVTCTVAATGVADLVSGFMVVEWY